MNLYRKLICILLICYMLLLGISMSEVQKDSFFALSEREEQSQEIGKICDQMGHIRCILKQNNDFYEENSEKVIQRKNRKVSIEWDIVNAESILHMSMFVIFQKADIKLWMPSHLTNVITVLFIHHQDGQKRNSSLI